MTASAPMAPPPATDTALAAPAVEPLKVESLAVEVLALEPAADALPPRRGRPPIHAAGLLHGRILCAAWDVLLDTGIEAFTIDRVARHARIGKATIYARFASKRELLTALINHGIARKRAAIHGRFAGLPLEAMLTRRAVQALTHLFSADGLLLEQLIDWLDHEAGSSQGGLRGQVFHDAIEQVEAEFRAAAARGEIVLTNPAETAQFWLEGLLGHYKLAWSAGHNDLHDHTAWATGWVRHFFAGLRVGAPASNPPAAD